MILLFACMTHIKVDCSTESKLAFNVWVSVLAANLNYDQIYGGYNTKDGTM